MKPQGNLTVIVYGVRTPDVRCPFTIQCVRKSGDWRENVRLFYGGRIRKGPVLMIASKAYHSARAKVK